METISRPWSPTVTEMDSRPWSALSMTEKVLRSPRSGVNRKLFESAPAGFPGMPLRKNPISARRQGRSDAVFRPWSVHDIEPQSPGALTNHVSRAAPRRRNNNRHDNSVGREAAHRAANALLRGGSAPEIGVTNRVPILPVPAIAQLRKPKTVASNKASIRLEPGSLNFGGLLHTPDGKPGSGRIEKMEHRGIMIGQVQAIMQFIWSNANAGTGKLRGWHYEDRDLFADKINTYEVVHWIVKPLTRATKCSYVEAVMFSSVTQMPTWFVSHAWSEPVAHFLKSMQRHAQVRGDKIGILNDLRRKDEETDEPVVKPLEHPLCAVTTSYWVYAYAKCLHEPDTDMAQNPREAPLVKALQVCRGMLLMLDWEQPASPFLRSWCMFEVAVVVCSRMLEIPRPANRERWLLDISVTDVRQSRIFTDGLTDKEAHMESVRQEHDENQLSGWGSKTRREANFPAIALRGGLTVTVEDCQSADPIDRVRILNALAMRDGDSEVTKNAEMYSNIDKRLRAFFAGIGMRLAVQQGGLQKVPMLTSSPLSRPGSPRGTPRQIRQLPIVKALREDTNQRDLQIELAGCYHLQDRDMDLITRNIPKNVRNLSLNLRRCHQLNAVDEAIENLSHIKNLRHLKVDLQDCVGLDADRGLRNLADRFAKLENLVSCSLNFKGCHKLADSTELAVLLGAMKGRTPQIEFSLVDPLGVEVAAEKPESRKIPDVVEAPTKKIFTFSGWSGGDPPSPTLKPK